MVSCTRLPTVRCEGATRPTIQVLTAEARSDPFAVLIAFFDVKVSAFSVYIPLDVVSKATKITSTFEREEFRSNKQRRATHWDGERYHS